MSPGVSLPAAVAAVGIDSGIAWHYGDPMREQRILETAAGVIDRSNRPVLAISGSDRLPWLHSICSQHVSNLADGESTEALVLSPHGHVEQHWQLTERDGTVWLDIEPGMADDALGYLQKMRFLKRVEPSDVSDQWAVIGLVGPAAATVRDRSSDDPARGGLDRHCGTSGQGVLSGPGDGGARAESGPAPTSARARAPGGRVRCIAGRWYVGRARWPVSWVSGHGRAAPRAWAGGLGRDQAVDPRRRRTDRRRIVGCYRLTGACGPALHLRQSVITVTRLRDDRQLVVRRLDRHSRRYPRKPGGVVPVPPAEQVHDRRHEHRPQDEGVDEDRAREAEADELDDAVVAEHESAEDRDHDDRRRRDDAAGLPLTDRNRAAVVVGVYPLFVHAAYQEYLVVHRQAEQDREEQDGSECLDRATFADAQHLGAPAPLEDRNDKAE